ncbi:MAG: hypothetical protein CSA66_07610 [Proteobacteria bacterium]|nr:MAG: hypothetical protein CSA66_07610 [Pseudomonadota bacterium]
MSCAGAIPNGTATCRLNGASPRCEVASCDAGYYQAGPLTCLAATGGLCSSCAGDEDCPTPGDRCLSVGGRDVCGYDCSADNLHGTPEGECPAGFSCTDVGAGDLQCVPTSDSCDCLPGDEGGTRTCSTTNAEGTCYGVETCDPTAGWSACSAPTPAAETCNGQDDNCNGQADEGVTHDPTTCDNTVSGVGTCTGTYVCTGAGGWQCPVATPAVEVCNFADDDCDGAVDETFKNAGGQYVDDDNCGSCGVSCSGAIANGVAFCNDAGGAPRCEVAACDSGYYQASPLTCLPATDNTCGTCATDANCPTPGDRCLLVDGRNVCGYDCAAGNLHGTPEGECPAGFSCTDLGAGDRQCVPTSASCDCLPGDGGTTRTCEQSNDQGTCYGIETCDPATGWTGCTAWVPAAETCDGQDNNCNGRADEDVTHDPVTCSETVNGNTCSAPWVCSGAGGWTCDVATPQAETCNFADDDCDGEVDEDFRDASGLYVHDAHCRTCGASCDGAVSNATAYCDANGGNPRCEIASCDAGYWQASDTVCLPAVVDTCSACVSDEDCSTPGDRCVPIDGGMYCGQDCSAGNVYGNPAGSCSQAGFVCQAFSGGSDQCVPASASCDCLAGDEGKTRICTDANAAGTCYGVEVCDPAAGWLGCTAKTPVAETCNGLDDDCDSAVDEGVAHDPATCSSSVSGVPSTPPRSRPATSRTTTATATSTSSSATLRAAT